MQFDFDTPKPISGARSAKWDSVSAMLEGASPDDALPMWIAQMDFLPAPVVQDAAAQITATGEYGYFTGVDKMFDQVAWWYQTRHGWAADPAHMLAVHGLGNGIGLALQALTDPGDEVIIFGPVYHEFALKLRRNGRVAVESPLVIDKDGLFRMDLAALESGLTGREKAVLFCSPHNPAGRVWEPQELADLAAFCDRHDLLLISDEIHQDLTFPGHKHLPMALAAPEVLPRLVVFSAASKTFDIAGLRVGVAIIPDDDLRARFKLLHSALDIQPNRYGTDMTAAAYSPQGAAWVDALMVYLDENRRIFCEGVNAIPGLRAMPMQSTYLAWVDYSGTGLDPDQIAARVRTGAHLAPTPGVQLGAGGQQCDRFNIGTQRVHVADAVSRLKAAFADLQ